MISSQQQQPPQQQRIKIYEPHQRTNTVTEQVIRRRQMERRQYEMTHPRVRYQQPVYVGTEYAQAQPRAEQYLDYYGHGPRPDHYYPGLTPRDVLLARAQPGQVTGGLGMPQLLKNREVAQRRKILETLTAVLYEGQLPSADDIDFFLHSLMESVDMQLHRSAQASYGTEIMGGAQQQQPQQPRPFSEDTKLVLGDLREVLGILIEINRQKNADDKIQCFIHHAVLAKRAADEHFRRLQMRTGAMQDGAAGPSALPDVSALSSMARLLVGSDSFRSLVFDLREWVSKLVMGGGGESVAQMQEPSYAYPMKQQQQHQQQQIPGSQYPGYQGGQLIRDYSAALRQPLNYDIAYRTLEDLRMVMREMVATPQYVEAIQLVARAVMELGAVRGPTSGARDLSLNGMVIGMPLMEHEENRKAMMNDLKDIVEAFAGGYSLDNLIAIVDEFQLRYEENWEMRDLFDQFGEYFRRSATDSRYLDGSDFVPKGVSLLQALRKHLAMQHGDLINAFLTELFSLLDAFQNDPLTTALGNSMGRLLQDLVRDPMTGRFSLKLDLLRDIREVYAPIFLRTFRYIPLPRIEINDPAFDLTLDNVILQGENILPSLINASIENNVQISPLPDLPSSYFLSILNLDLLQIQLALEGVEFEYRRKRFPYLEESCLANIFLSGTGLSVHAKIAFDPNLPQTTLIPLEIEASMDSLRIELVDPKYKALYSLLGKSAINRIKRQLCQSIEQRIMAAIRRMDYLITQNKGLGKQALQQMLL